MHLTSQNSSYRLFLTEMKKPWPLVLMPPMMKGKVSQYDGQIILVGINYDSKSKKHDCKIEIYGDLTHRF